MGAPDLTLEQRRAGAAQMRTQLETLLKDPTLSEARVKAIREQIARIDAWENGVLPEDIRS